jgi:amino acid adenylation domain-containing protein
MDDTTKPSFRFSPQKRALLESLRGSTTRIQRRDTTDPAPLSFAQQRLWFLEQLTPNEAVYLLPTAYRLHGPLNRAALGRALNAIVARHEVLRTTFAIIGDRPAQIVAPSQVLGLPCIDLSALPAASRQRAIAQRLDDEAKLPFDLTAGPLLRATLLCCDADDHLLLLTLHHSIADGWSLGVLNRELAALYSAEIDGTTAELPGLDIQYADFAAWQHAWLAGTERAAQLDFWRRTLAGAPPLLELPTDRPRPAQQTFAGTTLPLELPADLSSAAHALSKRLGVTPFMLLLAAFQALLARYTGQNDIVVGTPIAGRTRAETENLIGFFVNTLALRTSFADDPDFATLVGRVREVTLDAYAHQDLPFEKLVEGLQPERTLSHSPIFQVMFLYSTADAGPSLPGMTVDVIAMPSTTAKFDLTLALADGAGGIKGVLEYNRDLFDQATMERMIGHFQALLAGALADPTIRVSRLPLLSEAESRTILFDWNATTVGNPWATASAPSTHGLFETQAAQTPDAPAIVIDVKHSVPGAPAVLSFADLNNRANQISAVLHDRGVRAGALVGVALRRSPDLIAAILGILKAGAAYVPLDPTYPRERLAYMLADTQVALVVTEHALTDRIGGAQPTLHIEDLPPPAQHANPLTPVTPEHLAYVIYTSGSTGQPKGVMVHHRGLVNYLRWAIQAYAAAEGAGAPLHSSIAFDLTVTAVLVPLLAGRAVHLLAEESGVAALGETLGQQSAPLSLVKLTPAHLELLSRQIAPAEAANRTHTFVVGGENLLADQIAFWARHAPATRIVNEYGPTETVVGCAIHTVTDSDLAGVIPIGRPIANTELYVLDRALQPVPIGVVGELYIGGAGVAHGYLNQPALTAARFVPDLWSSRPGARLYRSGDLARYAPDGTLECLGRRDDQVKIRGFRIELGEIEAALLRHAEVREAAVTVRGATGAASHADKRVVAYVVPAQDAAAGDLAERLRVALRAFLPEHMLPAAIVILEAMPLTVNGKVDRRALPAPALIGQSEAALQPSSEVERTVAAIWAELLGRTHVGRNDNFFDLGGHSLLLLQAHSRLQTAFGERLSVTDLFKHPTVATLASALDATSEQRPAAMPARNAGPNSDAIAIVGMSCRFPGADSVEAFWGNLLDGVEAVTTFSDEQLIAAGADPTLLSDPFYIKSGAVLDGIDRFDAQLFEATPREAEIMDPQHRLFLECSWEALEHAGYDSLRHDGRIGVFAGAGASSYLLHNLLPNPELVRSIGEFQLMLSSDKDFIPTRVSYTLNLRGPSISIHTACSTALVALHMASQSLRSGECDMALAGGVSVAADQGRGYLYQTGGILSPDGHCRPFDAQAQGTIGSSGVGIAVLKRLEDALADGDTIHAVIRGSATNNDGAAKVGYAAPSVEGQADVIVRAQQVAGVEPESIGYIEAHGTGTTLGDPIEVAALTQAFRAGRQLSGQQTPFCALGSVKSNIGHTDAAAGIAGLIKAVMAIKHAELPPSLHCTTPNPKIDFAGSPFYVNTARRPWPAHSAPRRAGVSAFGIGGTNVHVILEEAAPIVESGPARPWQLLVLSAKTSTALDTATANLQRHLREQRGLNLADVAYTLQQGRRQLGQRRVLVCRDPDDAIEALGDPKRLLSNGRDIADRRAIFMFPGQGSQYAGMAADLYAAEAGFRTTVDECATILQPLLGLDLRELLFPQPAGVAAATALLAQTRITQPALFVVEYALARLLMDWGIEPQAMIGHSIGEYVAACLAEVFSLGDALRLVAARGRLMQMLPAGAMLAVPLPAAEVAPFLGADLALAAINGPSLCVVAGPGAAIDACESTLRARGLDVRRLHTSHAFHSAMMDPVIAAFTAEVASISLRVPQRPFISNVSGTWITAADATDPAYWARHLRQTVRFADGVQVLLDQQATFIEVGPGRTLASLVRQAAGAARSSVTAMRHPQDQADDLAVLLEAVGRLWLEGVAIDWRRFSASERRRRLPLPTYPFERRRHWIERPQQPAAAQQPAANIAQWTPAEEAVYDRPTLSSTYIAPRDSVEEQIATIWHELLGIAAVGIHDNFFELGGHSLLATQLVSRLRAIFQIDLPIEAIFDHATVEDLAKAVVEASLDQTDDELLAQMLEEMVDQ